MRLLKGPQVGRQASVPVIESFGDEEGRVGCPAMEVPMRVVAATCGSMVASTRGVPISKGLSRDRMVVVVVACLARMVGITFPTRPAI